MYRQRQEGIVRANAHSSGKLLKICKDSVHKNSGLICLEKGFGFAPAFAKVKTVIMRKAETEQTKNSQSASLLQEFIL